jgi:tRNA(fMet)-specific endonuclease VapC
MPNTEESVRSWKRQEKPIGGNDLLIASHANATGATIVTANTDEFKRIRGLNVENWLA